MSKGHTAHKTAETRPVSLSRIDVSAIDRFEIDAEIGRGGMAVVYAAKDRDSGERVALKVLNKGVDQDVRARFQREVKAASILLHPGICRVIAFGESEPTSQGAEATPFLAMELVEGHTLTQASKKWTTVPGVVAAEILRQLLEALACAHGNGVVHRDLKPQNVMLTPAGALKLLDFGIARSIDDDTVTKSGVLVGTPAFMSPEQARCEEVDSRSDLFSAALTVAAVLRKNHRFAGAGLDPTQMLMRVAYDPLGPLFEKSPHLPLSLDVVIAGLTRLIPDQRYPSALVALEALGKSQLLTANPAVDGPALLARYAHDPVGVGAELNEAAGKVELAFAEDVATRAGGEHASVLALHRAVTLGAGDDVAVRLRVLASKQKLTFDEPKDEKIVELLRAFKENPAHPGVLKALADRMKALGATRHAAIYLWRYVVEKPEDMHAAQMLTVMLEGPVPPRAATSTTSRVKAASDGGGGKRVEVIEGDVTLANRLSTMSIVAGIKSGGLKRPQSLAAGVPTRAMNRPGMTPMRGDAPARNDSRAREGGSAVVPHVVLTSVPGGHADAPSWIGKAIAAGILVVALSLAAFFLGNAFSLTKKSLDASSPTAESAAVNEHAGVARATGRNVDLAETALASGDPVLAMTLASEVLQSRPSLAAGRSALWVRARAQAALGKRAEALADCEVYLQKATEFDDPNLAAVKKLMSDLRATSTGPVLE